MTGRERIKQNQIKGLTNDLLNKVDTNDFRLSDARTPISHTQDISTINGLSAALNLKADIDVFSGNFSLGYNDNNQVIQKTYTNNNYIVFSYNEDNSINQKKSYLSDDTLVLTQTAQYNNNLFIGWV